MNFLKYQHIERYGNSLVDGIEKGECFIFPKIDGTNSSVWLNANGDLKAGSRNRELTLEKDNAGFYNLIKDNKSILEYLKTHPNHRLYGEFLVPHTLKNYEDTAWKKFYVFDVCIGEELNYIPYSEYCSELAKFGIDFIKPLGIVTNGKREDFEKYLDMNTYLIKEGIGEGIVIKNYDYTNRFGRTIWAKIIASEFKEKKNIKVTNKTESLNNVENTIVNEFITSALVEKEYSKIITENNMVWENKFNSKLLGMVYYSLIDEEMWNILKKYKNCTINFKLLHKLVDDKVKNIKSDLF